jgi:hypothetical protein
MFEKLERVWTIAVIATKNNGTDKQQVKCSPE